jgi:hypothetical protein
VLQRRGDFGKPDDYFFKSWKKYTKGFGDQNEVGQVVQSQLLPQDHWVGLKYWSNLTMSTPQQLLIEMEDWEGNRFLIP